jgi:hypothetical protein
MSMRDHERSIEFLRLGITLRCERAISTQLRSSSQVTLGKIRKAPVRGARALPLKLVCLGFAYNAFDLGFA